MIVPVILAGGLGSRLWPLSREAYPKQFIDCGGGPSLFQQTLARLEALSLEQDAIVMGNEQHRFLMAEQIRQSCYSQSRIVVEPCFRGTAPAVAFAAMEALVLDEEALLLVLPADHQVASTQGFLQTVEQAMPSARQGQLVAFGVVPTHPETGYGYIERGEALSYGAGYKIARFVEKPTSSIAKNYCESGRFWWNSGMFLLSAASFLQALMVLAPTIYEAVHQAFQEATREEDFIRPHRAAWEACPTDSIDCAVMEKTYNGVVVPLHSPWSDVGAWDAWMALFSQDEQGNVSRGDVWAERTQNTYIQADHRLVVTLGINNLMIIETADAVLVLPREEAQSVKGIVTALKQQGRKEVIFHRRVNRPWGAFESIDQGQRFQVKHITVAVGQRLSLQRHQHRSEHWVVVQGNARVTRGEETFLLSENQSTYIPMGMKHRLENVGTIPLDIIEVQSGEYLGEDDIERFEDQYGREKDNNQDNYEENNRLSNKNVVLSGI